MSMWGAISSHYVATTAFNPNSLSNILGWYSSDAITGLSSGDQISTWEDLSAANNDLTGVAGSGGSKPLYRTTTGPSGGKGVEFTSGNLSTTGGYFTFPASPFGSPSAMEIMLTIKTTTTQNSLWMMSDSSSGQQNHYPFDGTVYENWGRANRITYTPSMSISSTFRRLNIWSASNDYKVRLDETDQYTSASNTVQVLSSPLLGRATNSAAYHFGGLIGCMVIIGRKLTTTERSDLVTWMTANPSGGNV